MQFSIVSIVAALAVTASATYAPSFNTTSVPYYPSGTAAPSGTAPVPTSSSPPFTGAASVPTNVAGSAMAMVIAGGVALMI